MIFLKIFFCFLFSAFVLLLAMIYLVPMIFIQQKAHELLSVYPLFWTFAYLSQWGEVALLCFVWVVIGAEGMDKIINMYRELFNTK